MNNFSKGSVHLLHIRRSRADASKLLHSGHLFNVLINGIIRGKSQKPLCGLLVRQNLNVFQLPRHDSGALAQAIHGITRRIELAGERADHVTVFVELTLNRPQKLPDFARPLLQG